MWYRMDRYRATLKGTWKDEPKPAAGQVFDLGSHLIDQTLTLFGRPNRIFANIQNVRQLGSSGVDDSFTILFMYDAGRVSKHPFEVTLKASILSVRSSQGRYVLRGTKGTYIKHGVDNQEDTLKAIKAPAEILAAGFGQEPGEAWGTLEYLGTEGEAVKKAKWESKAPGGYVNLFRNLAGAIRNGDELAVKWAQAAEVIEMIELSHQSSKERTVVEVPQL